MDFVTIIGLLIGAYVLTSFSKGKQAPASTPTPVVSPNKLLMLSVPQNPGCGPTGAYNVDTMPVYNSIPSAGIQQTMPTDVPHAGQFTFSAVGYATDLGAATSLGRCRPDGTCFQ